MDPEGKSKYHEDHVEGQARCQIKGTSSRKTNLEATSHANQEVTSYLQKLNPETLAEN
jgi:hypothetical protein